MTPDDELQRTDIMEINFYIENRTRIDGAVPDDRWLYMMFRRLWLGYQELKQELADDRQARKEWLRDYDRLLEVEGLIKRRIHEKSPPAVILAELVKAVAKKPKLKVG